MPGDKVRHGLNTTQLSAAQMTQNSIAKGLGLLRQKNVRNMFIAYLATYTGNAMAPIAMAFGVLEMTGSTADASIVIAAATFASILVLMVGGVVADRIPRRTVLIGADTVAAISQLCMATLFLTGTATIPLLTLFMLVNGVAIAFYAPASTGFVVQLVERADLQNANALLGTARNGAITGGAALGGVLVAVFGAGITIAIDAVTFAVSALLIMTTRPRMGTRTAPASFFAELKDGWVEFTSHTWLWVIVIQFALVVAALEGVFGLIGPAFTRDFMEGARDWGFIASSYGIGTLLGGIAAMRISVKYPMRLGTMLVFLFCTVPIAFIAHAELWVIMLAAVIAGGAGQIFAVLWYTTLQTRVPEEKLSRVSAYDHLGSIALAPLGIVAAGSLYESIGADSTFTLVVAVVAIATALALCVRDVRHVRSIPLNEPSD